MVIVSSHQRGLKAVAVSWGYHRSEHLQEANPDHLVGTAEKLKEILK
jgi:phosphoglycolate phosphatase-like HAD superfamily hydrolase